MTEQQARRITNRIQYDLGKVWELVRLAYIGRAWSALGYQSWGDYCTREFGTARLRLPREERAEVVASLREAGLSDRAIESATGVSRRTLIRDRQAGGDNVTTSGDADADTLAEELIASEPPGAPTESTPGQTDRVNQALERARGTSSAQVIGIDGKRYRPKPPEPAKPRRKPITDAFATATYDTGKKIKTLTNLAADDRFSRNGEELAHRNLGDLQRAHQQLGEVITQLQGWWDR
ncbi:hypothetical protein [Mycobacterium interjectum]|uniref:hypothetical protein n=1 Tax=Mycobacterium interjectum TaxID=33895 RepID=UPI0008335B35|nr:hypothetical protein [Mycobacterium interjectum]MCV7090212.1 hypothetical protein [Mycobacterium interjectum]